MNTQWWSWALTSVGVTGLWLAGRRRTAGWVIGLCAQGLWLAYALTTRQYGFLVSAFAYGAVYFTNIRRWRREAREEQLRAVRAQKVRAHPDDARAQRAAKVRGER